MKKKRLLYCNIIILIAITFICLSGCKKTDDDTQSINTLEKSNNQTDYGKPKKAHYHTYDHDEKTIKFTVIADNHVDANTWIHRNSKNMKRNRWVIDAINQDNENGKVHFIVQLGDMIDAENVQNLVAFRQLWENNYPGHDGGAISGALDSDYNAYSCSDVFGCSSRGTRINLPVYCNIGNHGAPTPCDGWNYARDYVSDRLKKFSSHDNYYDHAWSTYWWRSGRYIFLHLGLSACSYSFESNEFIDFKKLKWIKNILDTHAPDSTMGVFILQHYGWDGQSTDGNWWSKTMREMMINVLCRRESSDQPCHPYNVLGIFTGHYHEQEHHKVFAGYDADSNKVYFDNIVFDDAGAEDAFGYTHVFLDNGDTMYTHYHKKCGDHSDWHRHWGKDITILD